MRGMNAEKHIPVAYRDHSDAWIECSCGWGSFGSDGEEWLEHSRCTCPTECDCANPEPDNPEDVAHCSEECPIHNWKPAPALTCPVHGESGATQ